MYSLLSSTHTFIEMFNSFIDFHNQILIALHKNLNLINRKFNQHSSYFRCSLWSDHLLDIVVNYFTNLVFIVFVIFLDCRINSSSLILKLLSDNICSLIWLNHCWLRRHPDYWCRRHPYYWCRWKWRHSNNLLRVQLSILLHHHVGWSWSLHLLLSICAVLLIIRTITRTRIHSSASSMILNHVIKMSHLFINLRILINELKQLLKQLP
jgi:hypothetical protein